jgi:hypothetical protein
MRCGWEPQTLEEGQPDAKACSRVTLWLPWRLRWEKIHLTENFPPTYRYLCPFLLMLQWAPCLSLWATHHCSSPGPRPHSLLMATGAVVERSVLPSLGCCRKARTMVTTWASVCSCGYPGLKGWKRGSSPRAEAPTAASFSPGVLGPLVLASPPCLEDCGLEAESPPLSSSWPRVNKRGW